MSFDASQVGLSVGDNEMQFFKSAYRKSICLVTMRIILEIRGERINPGDLT